MAYTRDFHDDMESYSAGTMPTTLWGQDGSRILPEIVTAASDDGPGPRGGTKMMRLNWDATQDSAENASYTSARIEVQDWYTDELFIRFYQRMDDNMDVGAKFARLFELDPTYLDLFESTGLDGGDGMKNERGGGPTYWGDGFPVPSGSEVPDDSNTDRANWHKVEFYIKQTGGILKCWHDGELIRNESSVAFGGQRWGPFYISSNHETAAAGTTNYVYIDDVEVFTDSGAGDATTGSMSDASIEASEGGGDPLNVDPETGFALTLMQRMGSRSRISKW